MPRRVIGGRGVTEVLAGRPSEVREVCVAEARGILGPECVARIFTDLGAPVGMLDGRTQGLGGEGLTL